VSYVENMFDLSGTVVALSGGGGTIATAMAKALVGAGASVAIWSRRRETVDKAVAALDGGRRVVGIVADAGDAAAVTAAIDETTSRLAAPSVLINAVGGNRGRGSFLDIDVEVFEEVLRLNLVAGLVLPSKLVCRYWVEHEMNGAIINIASMSSFRPLSGIWAYDAAKSAVVNLTQATAKELAPMRIRVNGIAPGFFLAEQNRALLVKNAQTGELTERGQQVIARTPFGRFGQVDELAGATLFLASERASGFVTGATIPVDGGFLVDNL